MSSVTPPRSAFATVNLVGYVVACAGSLAVIIGSLGPWAVVQTPFSSLTLAGTSTDDGKVILIAACVAAVALLLRAVWNSIIPLVLALLAGILCAIASFADIFETQSLFADDPTASLGWGLWLVGIGSVALLLGIVLCMVTQVRNGYFAHRIAPAGTRRTAQG